MGWRNIRFGRWFNLLNSIYRNIYGFLTEEERAKAEDFYKQGEQAYSKLERYNQNYDFLNRYNKSAQYRPPSDFHKLLHEYHKFIATVLKEHDLLIPIRTQSGLASE